MLDRQRTLERLVEGAIDRPHAARAEWLLNPVAADLRGKIGTLTRLAWLHVRILAQAGRSSSLERLLFTNLASFPLARAGLQVAPHLLHGHRTQLDPERGGLSGRALAKGDVEGVAGAQVPQPQGLSLLVPVDGLRGHLHHKGDFSRSL